MSDFDRVLTRRRQAALEEVQLARTKAEEAGQVLRSSIVNAVESGATHADVGKAAGLTRSRVSQIIDQERRAS